VSPAVQFAALRPAKVLVSLADLMVKTGADPAGPAAVVNETPALVRKSRALSQGVGVFHGVMC
jgi:hypothetical protein